MRFRPDVTSTASTTTGRRSTRRGVLAAVAAAPVVVAGARAVSAAVTAVPFLRPAPDGTSATRCAQCGSADHTMLDPACPAAPEVG